jgi:tetratricopeptide (TPR) repeat protein
LIQSIESAVAHTNDQQLQYTFACFAGWVEVFLDHREEAIQRWEAALAHAITLGDLRWNADFRWGIGFASYYLRRPEQSERHLRECLRLSRMLNSRYLIGEALFWIALILIERGEKVNGHRLLVESATIARREGSWRTLRSTLECLSDMAYDAGNLGQTEAIAHEALELARREGQIKLVQRLLYRLARVRLAVGDKDAAVALLDQALEADSNRPASIWHPAAALLLGKIHVAYGDIGAARHCYHQSLAATAPDTDPHGAAHVLEVIAALAADLGDPLIGARFWGAAAALRETAAPPVWHPNARFAFEPFVAGKDGRYVADPAWNAAWQAGRALLWEQVRDAALAWIDQTQSSQI